jgi:hypothetical protein
MKQCTVKKPRTFRVTYYHKQWFVTYVEANSVRAAERMIQKQLDYDADELGGSTFLHCADGITKIEVQP